MRKSFILDVKVIKSDVVKNIRLPTGFYFLIVYRASTRHTLILNNS